VLRGWAAGSWVFQVSSCFPARCGASSMLLCIRRRGRGRKYATLLGAFSAYFGAYFGAYRTVVRTHRAAGRLMLNMDGMRESVAPLQEVHKVSR
jgi:hypothetical protein